MKLVFLGTASCFPTPTRGVSCMALQWEETGEIWIFDCGEGSQIQIQRSTLRPGKVTKIFITHLHGDHLFGLPGFLCTLGNGGNNVGKKVELYGPLGLRKFVKTALSLSHSPLPYAYEIYELAPLGWQLTTRELHRQQEEELKESKLDNKNILWFEEALNGWMVTQTPFASVIAGPVAHRIPSFVFVIKEKDSPGSINVEKLKALGISPGPLYGQIKKGNSITAPDGRIVNPEDVLGEKKRGRKLCIFGDTYDNSSVISLCQDSDLIVHEATMEDSLKDKAIEYGHSTPSMAVEFSVQAKAKSLCITHVSPRYKPIVVVDQGENDEEPKDGEADDEDADDDSQTAKILLDEANNKAQELESALSIQVAEDFLEVQVARPQC